LSKTIGVNPWRLKALQACEPTKPAPPVTRILLVMQLT
jgi:hypothetical protein